MAVGCVRRAKRLLGRSRTVYRAVRQARIIGRYLARRPHEPDFAYFRHLTDRTGLFLDVGANSGQSALSFRLYHRRAPILSLEPNPIHERDLRLVKRIIPRFDFQLFGAASENRTLTLHVPVYDGVELTGEASLLPISASDVHSLRDEPPDLVKSTLSFATREIEVRRVDDLGLDPDFIKVDVEGYELEAVTGMLETIERSRPVMMVESSDALPDLLELLIGLDYDAFVFDRRLDELRPYAGEPQNVFLIPRSAL